MNTDTITVSIIIVTYNSLPAVRDCLGALGKRCTEVPSELIVVDNGSRDGTIEEVIRLAPDAQLISAQRNLGFAGACNLGATRASGEFLLFHNPDLVLDPGALGRLIGEFQRLDRPGAASGRMRFPDNSFQATSRNFPTIGNLIFSRGSFLSRFRGSSTAYTLPDYPDMTEVPAVAGTLMLIRRQVFDQLGGFDQRFFMYMEDTDLCYRLHKAGYRNFYIPSAGGVHLWGEGSTAGKMCRAYYHHRSVWKYFLKHFPGVGSFLILPLILGVNLLVTGLLPARKRRI